MKSIPLCRIYMDQGHETLECCQIEHLAKFLRTVNKHFLEWITRNHRNYSSEAAISMNTELEAATAENHKVQRFQSTGAAHATRIEALRIRQQRVVSVEVYA